ncbi:hypothetical protein [Spirosoma agri]|uniref:Uncharacterized protein n=1 Tax=Spirosoma agri TaxID=1987381 RepID=A0A6M0IM65_9BACT|nr:hypothetical protein [Spirosoma agri]NEU68705.1 hypothetical protein [Spirosoma agri]
MYLEERIEQVERQSETTARAVADLTVDVRAIRHDQTEGFKQVNLRFNTIDARFDKVERRLDRVETDIAELKQDVGTIKQTLQLVLTYLHEKLP